SGGQAYFSTFENLFGDSLKSAQEVAQYCATSCALVYSSRFICTMAMYPHSYPHLSAQLLAQLVFF
ncbi:hypothetical protein, partial [Pseudomonas lundensis]